ncbi:ADR276Wp [Eremothecium gossypii ATCC 10895]|uniref:ADR276Wp n=1 Tax=Eremothecium gossypii (strain ATCC 10895 / CBS 109.51 / FGSC 9923 / NRRL Y-1056) TaxID=284811 RepID=Q759K1_EREGS|nr:ADR276Wp [Eremothecium gossypii ATCC 10895]AAS52196.2 ADR276Wp [Eremothecium gossypii ATCC 10895]AEY96495.1 FADR276Wp [Eremothecium gossypii FDAG1]
MLREYYQRFLNQEQPTFTQLPGGFPEEVPESGEERRPSLGTRIKTWVLAGIIIPPLAILYCLAATVLYTVNVCGSVKRIAGFYGHRESMGHAAQFRLLLESLLIDSAQATRRKRRKRRRGRMYTFSSLYNLENGHMLPQLVPGGYGQLVKTCAEQGKFALVYLHDPLLADPLEYVNGVLSNEEMVGMMKRYQMLLWFGDVTTAEGLQVANMLKVRQFPFLGVMMWKSEKKLEFVGRLEGQGTDFNLASLDHKLQQAYAKLIQFRQQRQNRDLQRLMIEQQDHRYQESLRHDQERERLRQERRAEEARKQNWLLWRKSKLRPEPTQGDICKVGIRTGSGRMIRKFDASLPIEEIYAYVELYRKGILLQDEPFDQPPEDYQYDYGFILTTTMPRTELDPAKIIRDEKSIYPIGTVMVEQYDV